MLRGPEVTSAPELARLAELDKQADAGRRAIDASNWLTEAIAQRVADLLRPLLEPLRALLEVRQTPVRLLSVEATAKYLGRSPGSVRQLINLGTLRPVRIDGRVMLDLHDLDLLIKSAKT